jgi:hypothetical protein
MPDGSILFVRSRWVAHGIGGSVRGTLELLREGRVQPLARLDGAPVSDYYGYYGWSWVLAVRP